MSGGLTPAVVLPGSDEVLVLRVDQQRALAQHRDLFTACLAASERRRLARYKVEHARSQFLASRGILRTVLGDVLGISAAGVPLRAGNAGKPALEGHDELHFNLSHSAGLILVALTGIGPVGVDVEWLDPQVDYRGIASRFFTPGESQDIFAAADPQRRFFEYWTLKESAIKLSGRGLSQPLNTVALRLDGRGGASLDQQPGWQFRNVPVAMDYAAALALATGESWELRVRDWE
ncbi:MAG: 4'-phosphopantetheinyl transferase superfamily protein [Gammaproteobacteria bacterium]|jgi:4'-phosphopantetheinyl transferase|nr:4'-phosphopantetheinyl transferase superfamily protein [Gammaproteobacteria bacterium]